MKKKKAKTIDSETRDVMQHLQPLIRDIVANLWSRSGNGARGMLSIGLVKDGGSVYVLPTHFAKPIERFFEADTPLKYGKALVERINDLPEEFLRKCAGKYTVFIADAEPLDEDEISYAYPGGGYFIGVGVLAPGVEVRDPGAVILTKVDDGTEITVADFLKRSN